MFIYLFQKKEGETYMEYSTPNPLPALLKYFRKKSGFTQLDIASKLSISRSGYASYEEGRNLPSIEQTIKLSELLDHDLLYAYTLSSRYMQAQSGKPKQMVMESNSYLAAIEANQNTAKLLNNYKILSRHDQLLVDRFVENLSSKKQKDTEY